MNGYNKNFFKKLSRYLLIGLSAFMLFYISQNVHLVSVLAEEDDQGCIVDAQGICIDGGSAGGNQDDNQGNNQGDNNQQTGGQCAVGTWDANRCASCGGAGNNTYWGVNFSDYGSNTGSAEWCSCADRNNDEGSLIREGCPQRQRQDIPASGGGADAPACGTLYTQKVCNGLYDGYNHCTLKYESNKAYYDCYATQNTACIGKIYCEALDRRTTGGGGGGRGDDSGGAEATVNCPEGTTKQPGSGTTQSTIICIANANNNDNDNDNDNSNNNRNSSGSSSSSSSSSTGGSANITLTGVGGGGTTTIVRERFVNGNVGVGGSGNVMGVQQLPKTGLPALAWAALAFVPAGFRLRGFSKLKGDAQDNPNYLWENRQFYKH